MAGREGNEIFVPWLKDGRGFTVVGPGNYEEIIDEVKSNNMRMPSLDEIVSLFFEFHPYGFPVLRDVFEYTVLAREVYCYENDLIKVFDSYNLDSAPKIILPFKEEYFRKILGDGLDRTLFEAMIQRGNLEKLADMRSAEVSFCGHGIPECVDRKRNLGCASISCERDYNYDSTEKFMYVGFDLLDCIDPGSCTLAVFT